MKIIHISDTHGVHNKLIIEDCDVLVHSGDFSDGSHKSTLNFLKWFSNLKPKYKILVAGNHDKWFEDIHKKVNKEEFRKDLYEQYKIIYLMDDSVTINNIKFYGTPYSLEFYNWSFMEYEEELSEIYRNIPLDIDVLISHGPPKGILDMTYTNKNVGSSSLVYIIEKIKSIKAVLFGHIHESYGLEVNNNIIYSNASIRDYYTKEIKNPNTINI